MEKDLFAEIREIYELLDDAESKMIFMHRVNWYCSWDYRYISEMIGKIEKSGNVDIGKKRLKDFMANVKPGSKAVIFGAGVCGSLFMLYATRWNIDILAAADNNPQLWGGTVHTWDNDSIASKALVPIISPDELRKYNKLPVIITLSLGDSAYAVEKQLIGLGFDEIYFPDDVDGVAGWSGQYFDDELVKPDENEFFIDCGCLNMGTVRDFITWSENKYSRVLSFEASPDNYRICGAELEKIGDKRIHLAQCAVWNKDTEVFFDDLNNGSSSVKETGRIRVPAVKIDSYLKQNGLDDIDVTFIKMDIEGAEPQALEGAADTIRRSRPKLAISVYHKEMDLINITKFIADLNLNYKFYLRHYASHISETILYAIAE